MTQRTYAYAILFGPAALCVVAGMAVTLVRHPKKPAVELVSADIPTGSIMVYDKDGRMYSTCPDTACVPMPHPVHPTIVIEDTPDPVTGDAIMHTIPVPGGFVEGDIWATPEGLHIYWHGRERKMSDFIGSDELKR